jgi:hypothetical protein
MSVFRKTNPQDVIRYSHPNGEDWIEFRSDFSKREATKLMGKAPQVREGEPVKLTEAMGFQEEFFVMAASAWSGGPGRPTRDDYLDLPVDVAKWVDDSLGQHFKATIGAQVDDEEKKPEN